MTLGVSLGRFARAWCSAARGRIAGLVPRVDSEFIIEYRDSGLRMVLSAALVGIFLIMMFVFIRPLSLVSSVWLLLLRILMLCALGVFVLLVIRKRDFVLRNYIPLCTIALLVVLGALALLIDEPGVVSVDKGYSAAPVLLFTLFLLYGFVRLPIIILLVVGSAFTVAVLGAERDVSRGADFYRIVLYALLSNLMGAFLAYSVRRREELLFRERRMLFEAKDLLVARHRQLRILHDERNLLLAAVNHDVKQPLLALDVQIGVLEKIVSAQNSEQARGAAAGARDALLFVRFALDDLLYACRVGRDSTRKLGYVDLKELVTAAVEVCAPLALEKSVRVRVRVARGDLTVFTDAALVARVIQNLLVNAIKFTCFSTRASGSVLVAARRRADSVSILVIDQGRGIPPDDIKSIWKPFYRSELVDGGGSGLGLYVVGRAMETLPRHSVSVESTLGRGSRFAVSLPCSEALAVDGEVASVTEMGNVLEGAYVVVFDLGLPQSSKLIGWIERQGALVDRYKGVGDISSCEEFSERLVDALLIFVRGSDLSDKVAEVRGIMGILPSGAVGRVVVDGMEGRGGKEISTLSIDSIISCEDLPAIRNLIVAGLEKNIEAERGRA
jgi:signal transduction histidine kinase